MVNRKIWLSLCLEISIAACAYAQISPGPLYSGHAQLEGIENCTKCHTVEKLISNNKCLACHKAIEASIERRIGYHPTVSAVSCTECHLDHLGRKYQIIRFNTASFDHGTTGFVLNGKHKTIKCRDCHNPNDIAAQDVKILPVVRRETTFLGLSTQCESCHEDIHKGQFSQSCSACHSTDHWNPADNFNHDLTSYPLTGQHKNVNCFKCHDEKLRDNKTVKFTQMQFSSCSDCHADPHKGQFKQPCSSCHMTESFITISKTEFDHSKTSFPLLGKHAGVKCAQCHESDPRKRNVSGGFGFHIVRFQLCSDCHSDGHAGQFADRPDKGKCESCHTVAGWTLATYTIADHQKGRFVLDGAHLAVPCSECHLLNKVKAPSTMQFHWNGSIKCITCHADTHKDQFKAEMTNGCKTCHITDSWASLPNFSHNKTKFPLRGAHAKVECSKCHVKPVDPWLPIKYVGLDTACSSCHSDEHQGQFQLEGSTDCARCHIADSWHKLIFNHDTQSSFALTGKHADVPCSKCHASVVMNGKETVKYKPLGNKCTDCHSAAG
ncbi:MAG: cytochrome C [Candidatus Kryptoniota bacterium]